MVESFFGRNGGVFDVLCTSVVVDEGFELERQAAAWVIVCILKSYQSKRSFEGPRIRTSTEVTGWIDANYFLRR